MLRRITITVPMYASSNSVKNKQNLEKFCLFFIFLFLFYFITFKAKHLPLRSATATRQDVNTRSTISLSTEFNSVTTSVERYQSYPYLKLEQSSTIGLCSNNARNPVYKTSPKPLNVRRCKDNYSYKFASSVKIIATVSI